MGWGDSSEVFVMFYARDLLHPTSTDAAGQRSLPDRGRIYWKQLCYPTTVIQPGEQAWFPGDNHVSI